MIKVFASDLDGTLLYGREDGKVSQEMFDLIRQMKARGILFAAASGRQYYNLKNLFAPVWEDMVFISENGAALFYKDQLIAQKVIPMEELLKHVAVIEADPVSETALSSATTTYIRPKKSSFEQELIDFGNHTKVVENWSDITEECVKIAFYEEAGADLRIDYWKDKFEAPAKAVTSGANWIDILYPDSHKGVGMEMLAKYFHVSKEEMLAVGDNYNDLEMLQAVAYPVAMDNAKEGLKEYCPYRTDSVENLAKRILAGELPKKK